MHFLLLLLLLATDYHGYIRCDTRGWQAIRSQAEYEAFLARIPTEKLAKKLPAPPSDDPLLQKPVIDFDKYALVAAWSENVHVKSVVQKVVPSGEDLNVEISFDAPSDYKVYQAPSHYGVYHLVRVNHFAGQLHAREVPSDYHGLMKNGKRGWRAIRSQNEYSAVLKDVQSGLPPTPPVDFAKEALIVAWSHNSHVEVVINSVVPKGDGVELDLSYDAPSNPDHQVSEDIGQFHAVRVPTFRGEVTVGQIRKKAPG